MKTLKNVLLLALICLSTVRIVAEDSQPPKRIKLVILDNSGTTNDCGVYAPSALMPQTIDQAALSAVVFMATSTLYSYYFSK